MLDSRSTARMQAVRREQRRSVVRRTLTYSTLASGLRKLAFFRSPNSRKRGLTATARLGEISSSI